MRPYTRALALAREGKKPTEIAEDKGIRIIFAPMIKIKGLAVSLQGRKFIVIDQNLLEEERQLVCGHELGHFELHPDSNFLFILENTLLHGRQEYEANMYAATLMLGDRLFECREVFYEAAQAAAGNNLYRLTRLVYDVLSSDNVEMGP